MLPVYRPDFSTTDALARVEAAARAAIAVDSTLAEPYAALGYAYHWLWRWQDADRAFDRAVALNPAHSTTRQWRGEYLVKIGRDEEGIAEMQRALRLDPLSLVAHGNYGIMLALAGREADAVAQLERTRAMDPSLAFPLNLLHKLYIRMGRTADALEAARTWAQLSGLADPQQLHTVVQATTEPAVRPAALAVLREWEREATPQWPNIAFFYLVLGERDLALTALEKGYEARSPLINGIGASPTFEPLRNERRFQRLLRAMGL